jgi:Predicted 3'-5' exonuclease related to the exonuclease domain of PolB
MGSTIGVREGRIAEVAAYCETDVVNTYRVSLGYKLSCGRVTENCPARPARFVSLSRLEKRSSDSGGERFTRLVGLAFLDPHLLGDIFSVYPKIAGRRPASGPHLQIGERCPIVLENPNVGIAMIC